MSDADDLLSAFRGYLDAVGGPLVHDFVGGLGWSMPRCDLPPKTLPCLTYLPRAAAIAGQAARPLALLLAEKGGGFHWGQTYTEADFGRHFLDNYGWLEVLGTRGHFASDRLAAGLLLLGPGIEYPDHHHEAEELYIPLTGRTEWRMGAEPFRRRASGETVHHRSNVGHAMRTGAEPLLALYVWRGGPLAARSTIGAAVGAA